MLTSRVTVCVFVVVQTMNDSYQRCLAACKQLRGSLSTSLSEATCDIDVASVSAIRLLYQHATDVVRSLATMHTFLPRNAL